MFYLDKTQQNLKIVHFDEVLPIDKTSGEKMQFNSPFFSKSDRKVLYLTKNPKKLS